MPDDRPDLSATGLDGQPPRAGACHIDPRVNGPYGCRYVLPKSPSNGKRWLTGQITIGNIVTTIALLLAAGAWMSTTENAPGQVRSDLRSELDAHKEAALKDGTRVQADIAHLQQTTVSREMMDAKMALILEQIKAINERLARMERMR